MNAASLEPRVGLSRRWSGARRVADASAPGLRPLVTRRRLQCLLGLLWLLDGLLQLQPSMFSAQFFGMMLRMGPAEPPSFVWDLGSRLEPLLTTHAALADGIFASLQLAIGLALVCGRLTRLALAASIPWALAVWLLGESGAVFTPGANALTGAPGAALVYALAALLVWPRRGDAARAGSAVADSGALVRPLPELCWVALWLGTALLECESLNAMPILAGSEIANAANGGPGWMSAIDVHLGAAIGDHGAVFAAGAGIVQAVVGLSVLHRRTRRGALAAGALVALAYGLVGQAFGGILSGGIDLLRSGATDPGTAPIVILVAASLWPRRARRGAGAPAQTCTPPRLAPAMPAMATAATPAASTSASASAARDQLPAA
jgi:hypothetical protein